MAAPRRRGLASAILAAGLILGGVAPARAAKVIERIVAVVNDEILLDTELEEWAGTQLRGPPDLESAEGKKAWTGHKRKVLEQLIDARLIMQQAVELKLSVSAEEIDRAIEEVQRQNQLDEATFVEALKQQGFTLQGYRKNLRRQILELKVVNTAVRSRVTVSDEEVATHYKQSSKQMQGNQSAHLRMILIGLAPDAPAAEVERRRREALKLVELARAGQSFVELARAHSEDEGSRAEGGDLGWLGRGVLVEPLEEALAGMDPGEVRGPVRTERGWHLIELVERKAGDVLPFEEVKDKLRKQLYDEQVEKATQSWIRELRKKSHIDIRI